MPNQSTDARLLESQATTPVLEANGAQSGLLTALWLSPETASALAIAGGEAPEDLHVTLCYCGDAEMLGEVAVAKAIVAAESMARSFPPIVGTVSGIGRFQASASSGGKDVAYASVDAPGLAEFRTRLAESLRMLGAPPSTLHSYTPHITLAYIDPDSEMPVASAELVTLRFEALTVAVGDRRITIPFSGPDRYAEAATVDSPALTAFSEPAVALLGLTEAKGPKGSAWDVLLIKAGTSGNRRHYPAAVLESAVPLFEGARAYADHPTKDEQRNRPERSIRDVVGWFEGVRWDADEQGIRGTFRVLESVDWLRSALMSAWEAGKTDLLGFSINAMGRLGAKRADGSTLIEAIDSVASTDVVTTPGAGGRLLGVLESERSSGAGPEGDMDPEEIKRLIQEALASSTAGLLEAMRTEVTTAVAAAVPPPAATTEPDSTAAAEPVTEAQPAAVSDELKAIRESFAAMQRESRKVAIREKVRESKLPEKATAKLILRLCEAVDRREVDDAEVEAGIADIREMIAEVGPARPSWSAGIEQGATAHDKMKSALMGWFQGEAVDGVPPVRDLRESYAHWTNQNYLDADPYEMFGALARKYDSGQDHKRLQESLSTADWGQAFADVFYLQMIRRFTADPTYDRWRLFVSDVESVTDFRTRHFVRVGGYGNFAAVAEMGTYPEVATPPDEEVTYAPTKYGGIESVSMESLLGDRGNIVRALPRLMAEGGARTIYEGIMDVITTGNPTMGYDSVALYHSSHGNTGTTALSVAGVDAVNVAMRSQTSYGNSVDILGPRNTIKNIIVPNELEGRANRIANPSQAYIYGIAAPADTETVMDPHRWADKGLNVHVYDKLTDATDYWATADPQRIPTMVVGFLNGRSEPELFTQDQPNVGSMFTSDKVSFKLRIVFGVAILDHRGFYRQVVSG